MIFFSYFINHDRLSQPWNNEETGVSTANIMYNAHAQLKSWNGEIIYV